MSSAVNSADDGPNGAPKNASATGDTADGRLIPRSASLHELEEAHDGMYMKFLKIYYFPFFLKYHKQVLVVAFCALIICGYFGPAFLGLTKSDLDVPKGTPSYDAIQAFQSNYPDTSTWPPAFVVTTALVGNVICPDSEHVSTSLENFVKKYPDIVSGVSGFYELKNNPELTLLANMCIAPTNTTMLTTVYFKESATLGSVTSFVGDLLTWSYSQSTSNIHVACTGQFPLFNEMQAATETSFVLIDATVLPIAIGILGYSVQSWRHLINPLLNLICTLLLAFAILVPISGPIAINPFSPSIMMSLGIAICFDYTLFMLTRFKEEISRGRSKEDAVFASLSAAGHVVLVSGVTLFVTFALLIAFPQNFLQSVGWSCGAVVIAALITNLTVTPALLLTFDVFSTFERAPDCSWLWSKVRSEKRAQAPETVIPIKQLNDGTTGEPTDEQKQQGTAYAPVAQDVELAEGELKKFPNESVDNQIVATPTDSSDVAPVSSFGLKRGFWFYMPFYCTQKPLFALLIILGVTAPFVWQFLCMIPTSDDALIYLRGSPSLAALEQLKTAFPIGRMDPYDIIVNTNQPNGVLTQEYFQIENSMIHTILNNEAPAYVSTKSITALSYFNGKDVDFSTSMQYFNPNSTLYKSTVASSYRLLVGSLMNKEQSCSLVKIETIVNPNSQTITGFILDIRALLNSLDASTVFNGQKNVQFYLFGAYTTTLDVQNALYALVPVMISTTVIVVLLFVSVNFGSVALAVRLAFTIFISLAMTYGLMVIVYQPGPGQNGFAVLTPALLQSTGIYWIIPLMSFSILVGLALDYDIFLISRLVEFRRMGWSDKAAICLAVEKSGSIITAAGVIMSISFAGLLLPASTVLNQYGFSLFIGVAIDTFVVRTTVVPIVIVLLGDIHPNMNWWPTQMPPIALSPEDEMKAIMEGYWKPPSKKELYGVSVQDSTVMEHIPEGIAEIISVADESKSGQHATI